MPEAGQILRQLGLGEDKVEAVTGLSVKHVVDEVSLSLSLFLSLCSLSLTLSCSRTHTLTHSHTEAVTVLSVKQVVDEVWRVPRTQEGRY